MKKAKFLETIASKMRNSPLYSTERLNASPWLVMKLFNAFGPGTWYLTEYNPDTRIAFGYVTGLVADEWCYISIDELADLRFHLVPMIEIDTFFHPIRADVAFMFADNAADQTDLP